MKRLILARHAKSSWKHPELSDHDRPLNKRGKKAAPIMGKALLERDLIPEAIFASTSTRTRSTAALLAEQIGFPVDQIEYPGFFYGATPGDILRFVRLLDDSLRAVMLVGHNPTWTALCREWATPSLDNLPTAGILVVDLEIDSWRELPGKVSAQVLLLPRDFGCGGGQSPRPGHGQSDS